MPGRRRLGGGPDVIGPERFAENGKRVPGIGTVQVELEGAGFLVPEKHVHGQPLAESRRFSRAGRSHKGDAVSERTPGDCAKFSTQEAAHLGQRAPERHGFNTGPRGINLKTGEHLLGNAARLQQTHETTGTGEGSLRRRRVVILHGSNLGPWHFRDDRPHLGRRRFGSDVCHGYVRGHGGWRITDCGDHFKFGSLQKPGEPLALHLPDGNHAGAGAESLAQHTHGFLCGANHKPVPLFRHTGKSTQLQLVCKYRSHYIFLGSTLRPHGYAAFCAAGGGRRIPTF